MWTIKGKYSIYVSFPFLVVEAKKPRIMEASHQKSPEPEIDIGSIYNVEPTNMY
jgi:hypothetical protein